MKKLLVLFVIVLALCIDSSAQQKTAQYMQITTIAGINFKNIRSNENDILNALKAYMAKDGNWYQQCHLR